MAGELILASAQPGVQFPEATFLHNVDKPFEIHRMIPLVTEMDDATPPLVDPAPIAGPINKLIRLRVVDTSKNENLTKVSTLIASLVKANTNTWEWEDPYTLVRSEGLQVTCDSLTYPAGVDNIRVEISFQGFLIVIAPPTETR